MKLLYEDYRMDSGEYPSARAEVAVITLDEESRDVRETLPDAFIWVRRGLWGYEGYLDYTETWDAVRRTGENDHPWLATLTRLAIQRLDAVALGEIRTTAEAADRAVPA